MSDLDVRYERRGHVGHIVLDRGPVNALRTRSWHELAAALEKSRADPAARVLVLRATGSGPFCAGADVRELPMTPALDEQRQALVHGVLERLLHAQVPTIAAVSGACIGGGCALAASCDIRLATVDATFALREIDVGRCGGARHLMRVLPQTVVRQMAFTGAHLDAGQALGFGMLSELCADRHELTRRVDELAELIAAKSPTALRLAKQSLDLAEEQTLLVGYAIEQQFSLRSGTTADAAEAAAAFRERRPPVWRSEGN